MNSTLQVCRTCLSPDRDLVPLVNLMPQLDEVNIWKLLVPRGGICWECQRIVLKFIKFKEKAQNAQKLLVMGGQLPQLSTLVCKTNDCFNFMFNEDYPIIPGPSAAVERTFQIKIEPEDVDEIIDSHYINKRIKIEQSSSDDDDINKEFFDRRNIKKEMNDETNSFSSQELTVEIEIDTTDKGTDETATAENTADTVNEMRKRKRGQIKKKDDEFNEEDEKKLKEVFNIISLDADELQKMREDRKDERYYTMLPFRCEKCVVGFLREGPYETHLAKHAKSYGKFECDVCTLRFPRKTQADKHRLRHFVSYKCKLCQYSTCDKVCAFNHHSNHGSDTEGSIHCMFCGFVASTPQHLEDHQRKNHPIRCDECGTEFKNKNNRNKHIKRIHGPSRPFSCHLCKLQFVSKSRLESHIFLRHSEGAGKLLCYCAICDIQFKTINIYRNHIRNSPRHAEKKYICDTCGKSFSSKCYLSNHIHFYHLKKLKHKCEPCNKYFNTSERMKNHMEMHHGVERAKDFPCHVCGKKFFNPGLLRSHVLIHSEVRGFLCNLCGDSFKQKASLYNHNRIKHKGVKRNTKSQ